MRVSVFAAKFSKKTKNFVDLAPVWGGVEKIRHPQLWMIFMKFRPFDSKKHSFHPYVRSMKFLFSKIGLHVGRICKIFDFVFNIFSIVHPYENLTILTYRENENLFEECCSNLSDFPHTWYQSHHWNPKIFTYRRFAPKKSLFSF